MARRLQILLVLLIVSVGNAKAYMWLQPVTPRPRPDTTSLEKPESSPRLATKFNQTQDACQSNPCQNGGTCKHNEGTKFECICPGLIFGEICQDADACRSNPCQNGGTCHHVFGT